MIDSKGVSVNTSKAQGPRRKPILVTITPYNEQEKRVVNSSSSTTTITTTATGIPAPPGPPAPPPLPLALPSKKNSEDSVEMQSIESFKLKETPNPVIPKPPPTYFPVNNLPTQNGSPRHGTLLANKESPKTNGSPAVPEPPKTGASPTNNGQTLKPLSGKVAIRIGAYEGEVKQPSKLDFLSQQTKNGTDEMPGAPAVSRLQNELAATLQRSNLRRKTEGEVQSGVKPIPETTSGSGCANETTNNEPGKLPQSKVETLASALNKVTIKVNPDNNSR